MTASWVASYLRSLSDKERADLLRRTQLCEAAASAAQEEKEMKGNFNTPLESAFEHAFWLGFRHNEWVKDRKTEIKKRDVVYVWVDTIDNAVNDCMKMVGERRTADLEAERDEWKRRCEKMLTEQQRWADDACYCDFNKHGDRTLTCEYCEQVNCLQEIAEGRDNG